MAVKKIREAMATGNRRARRIAKWSDPIHQTRKPEASAISAVKEEFSTRALPNSLGSGGRCGGREGTRLAGSLVLEYSTCLY